MHSFSLKLAFYRLKNKTNLEEFENKENKCVFSSLLVAHNHSMPTEETRMLTKITLSY